MITEYFVCYGASSSQLQEAVNKAIKNGWQPLGGVAVSVKWLSGEYRNVPENELLIQAVVRVTKDHEEPGSLVVTGSGAVEVPLPVPEWEILARNLLREEKKINAIKVVRENTGLGLKEAKDLVESWESEGKR